MVAMHTVDLVTACPANTYSLSGATTCLSCLAGSSSTSGSSTCTCNAGFYSSDGLSTTQACTCTLQTHTSTLMHSLTNPNAFYPALRFSLCPYASLPDQHVQQQPWQPVVHRVPCWLLYHLGRQHFVQRLPAYVPFEHRTMRQQ